MRTTRDIIKTLLSNIGSRKEVDQYLTRFASVEKSQFAIIKVGGGILADPESLEALASSLTFLTHVGLVPIVVHGAGPQLSAALAEAGVESRFEDGLRVTTPEVLEVARQVFQRENLRLVEALESLGTRARPIPTGVFMARALDPARLGLVGEIEAIDLDPLRSCIRHSNALPVLSCLGTTADGQLLNVNADVATRELALRIKPFKIIFLTPTGGLLDQDGAIIPAINLAEDYPRLVEQPWISGGMLLKLKQIQQLLAGLPHTSSVSITRPSQLARELFTHKGSGTLVRQGEQITRRQTLEELDTTAVRALIEACFGRRLAPDYFERLDLHSVYLSNPLRAAAVVTRGHEGIPYLDKFAVTPETQGAGIGRAIWQRLIRDAPRLYWRSRRSNPINPWYFQQAKGSFRSGPWIVFWTGMSALDSVTAACIDHALSLPASLEPPRGP
ncbi:MAG: acetylglutamate kinase [Myxococcales bacterium]|nr:acetylglutamate kinase [Myxococcales bacterium]